MMCDSEDVLDYLESGFPKLFEAAVTVAYWQTLAAGYSVLEIEGDSMFETFPDGSRKFIKHVSPPTLVTKGTRVMIK